jgi:death on curing protein
VTRYLSLAEFWFLAEDVAGIAASMLIKASRVDLACCMAPRSRVVLVG